MMNHQRGYTLLELMMVVCVIGVLSMIAMTEFNKVHNRAFVGSAMSDMQLLRKAISMYDAEWGAFPTDAANDVATLCDQLVDPVGQPYIKPPSGNNFATFQYVPPAAGDDYGDYSLIVTCKDMHRTQITVHHAQDVEMVQMG
jgi:prepilin-type N-terminal cleavage/methylation domain-containing protein